MNRLIEYFVRQGVIVNIMTAIVFVFGAYSLVKIKREVFPNVNFDVLTVSTVYRGSSAETIEKLITNPLEREIKKIDGVKRITSTSVENVSSIVIQLDPDQTTEQEAKLDIQDIIDAFTDIPEDADEPKINSIESKRTPIVEVSINGGSDEHELRKLAKQLEKKIERIKGVAKVVFNGLRDYEIRVQADPKKLQEYDVSLQELIQALDTNNVNLPGGVLEPQGERQYEVIVRTIGEFLDAKDVEESVVRANAFAQPIKVKDLAKVQMVFEKAKIIYHTNAQRSISLTILKKESGDAINIVEQLKQTLEEFKSSLPNGISAELINDTSLLIQRRISVLMSNFAVGLLLVLVVLSLALPFSIALVTAFGIPFSFLGTILYFDQAGISINLISLMGLIIVVGMLVDDAIVVMENVQRYIDKGYSRYDAAIKGTQEVWAPVAASVLTTVMAFAPMMFMSGIFGKFVKFIPLGVVIALLISLFECYFILPHHAATWNKEKEQNKKSRFGFSSLWDNYLLPTYLKILGVLLKLRYLVAFGSVAFFVGSIWFAANKMDFVLFPPGGIEVFRVNLDAPVGTAIDKMNQIVGPIESRMQSLIAKDELDSMTTKIGLQQIDPTDPFIKRGSEYAQIMVYLKPSEERNRSSFEIIEMLRKEIGQPEGIVHINFMQIGGGPPVGTPVNVGVRGETYEEILPAIKKLQEVVAKIPGVTDLMSNYIEGKKELHIKIDQEEAAAANLNFSTIGMLVRAAFDGIVATSIKNFDDELDIRVSLDEENRSDTTSLDKLKITNMRGQLIPLKQVAKVEFSQGISIYEHEAGLRQVRLTGEVEPGVTTANKVKEIISEQLPALTKEFPKVEFHFGGETADTEESMQSLGRAFMVAFFGILMLLILLFKNLYQPMIVASTIPLGIASVVWTFYLHGRPLSFLGMIGIIALGGVIVNNAIVFVDFVNMARKEGEGIKESILSSAKNRLRPIFLTTITTVAGILPTAYGVGGLDPFVVPIALALGWGMAAGSLLTTLIFPCHLAILDDILGLFRKKRAI
ncbi:MAG: efflux RND transporter permease subunit [Oligoflexales bacterium]|nr:efflux RND transporter permease subunit [Oligoflexales bacterium]